MTRSIVAAAAAAGVAVCALWLQGCAGPEKTAHSASAAGGSPPEAVLVEVVRPAVQRVAHTLRAVGSFLADEEVAISAEVDGRVAEILADEGYPLERGQVVLRLETEGPHLVLERAQAQTREARAELDLQTVTLERREALLKDGVIARQAYDDALARKKLAEARLQRAEAVLRLARKSVKDTTVTSPLDAVVTARHAAAGEYITAGAPLFTAVSTHPLKLHFTLPERFAAQVRRGQSVAVAVKAYEDMEFRGDIYFISSQVDPDTRALQIKAFVANPDGLLKPGFFADVRLTLSVNEEAVVVPQEAVVLREGKTLAYVVESGVARERSVRTGEHFDGRVEILLGIASGELVVTRGNYALRDGLRVSVADDEGGAQPPV